MFLPALPSLGIYSQTALAAFAATQAQQVATTQIAAPDPLVAGLQSDGLDFSNGPAPNFFGQGRLDMIQRHSQTVASGTPLHEVVVSTRRAGKTALIRQSIAVIRQQKPKDVHPVFAEMAGRYSKDGLYQGMWRSTFGELPPEEGADQLADRYFDRLAEESRTKKIVIYVDEAGELHQADIHFFRRLRSLNDRVSIVFLSFLEDMSFHGQEVQQLGEGDASYSPSLNHFRWEFLPLFDPKDVAHLVSYRFFGDPQYAGLISPGLIQSLLLLSAGNVCMINRLVESWHRIQGQDREKARDLFDKDRPYTDFIEDLRQGDPQFFQRVATMYYELVLRPLHHSFAFGLNPYEIWKKLCETCFEKGGIKVSEAEAFPQTVKGELGITEKNYPIFRRILDYYVNQGFLAAESGEDGVTIYTIINYPAFLYDGIQRGLTVEDINRLFSGETLTPRQRQEVLEEQFDTAVPRLDEDLLARIESDFSNGIEDQYSLLEAETPHDKFGVALDYYAILIGNNLPDQTLRFFFPSDLDPQTVRQYKTFMTTIGAVVGWDIEKGKEFIRLLHTVPRRYFELQVSDGRVVASTVTGAAVFQALTLWQSGRPVS